MIPTRPLDRSGRTFHRILRALGIEVHELSRVALAAALFFCILCGYFAVRSVRETIGTLLGASRVADMYVAVWIFSILIVPLYGYVVGRYSRAAFLPWVYAVVAAVFVFLGVAWQGSSVPTSPAIFFSVFISVLNLVLTSLFWSFLLEVFSQEQGKRLFGVIAAGGTAGALLGPLAVDSLVGSLGNRGVLFAGGAMFVLAIICQRSLLARSAARTEQASDLQRPIGGKAFAGFVLLLRSPYLIAISGYVFLLAVLNTILYFRQLHLVQQTFVDPIDRTRFFERLDWIVQGATLLLQIAITGRALRRFGIATTVVLVPVLMIVGFVLLDILDTLLLLSIVMVARRVSENAFARPAREILFVPLNNEVRYKAKSAIDVPVYRGADALTAQLSNVLSNITHTSSALLGLFTALLCTGVAWFTGRRYEAIRGRRAHSE